MATAPSPNDLTRQQLDELDSLLQRMLALPLAPVDGGPPPATPELPDPGAKNWRADPPAIDPIPIPHLLAEAARERAADPVVVDEGEVEERPVGPPAPRVPVPPLPPIPVAVDQPAADAPDAPNPFLFGGFTPPAAPPPAPMVVSPLPAIPVAAAPVPADTGRLRNPARPAPAPPARGAHTTPPDPVPPAPPPAPVGTVARPSEPVPVPLVPFVALNRGFDALAGLFGLPGRVVRSGFGKNVLGVAGLGLLAYTAAHVAQLQGWVSLPVPLPWPR